jgi:hypothetical protein
MVASTVSSKMIGSMAEHEGFKFVDCLTGSFNLAIPEHEVTFPKDLSLLETLPCSSRKKDTRSRLATKRQSVT